VAGGGAQVARQSTQIGQARTAPELFDLGIGARLGSGLVVSRVRDTQHEICAGDGREGTGDDPWPEPLAVQERVDSNANALRDARPAIRVDARRVAEEERLKTRVVDKVWRRRSQVGTDDFEAGEVGTALGSIG